MIFMENKVTGVSLDNGNAFVVRFAKNIERLKGIYASDVAKFKKLLESKVNPAFLSNFHRNIRTAKIIESDKLPKKANGVYYNNKNTIFVRKNAVCSKEILFHELTHLSSNNNLDSMRRIGFFYDNTKEHFSIGYGINEGYTAYCNFKLFGSAIAYPFESLVSKTIEEIIGENTMEELFFNADLKRLIQELQKYVSENEIIDFLCKLDTFTYNGFNNKINDDETMIKAVNAVKSFLFKVIYISSKTKGLSSDEIDSIFKWYA